MLNRVAGVPIPCTLVFALGCDRPESRLSVQVFTPDPLSIDMVTVDVVEQERRRTFSARDFQSTSSRQHEGPRISVGNTGSARVLVTYQTGTDTVGRGELMVELKEEWGWSVVAYPAARDPRDEWMGPLITVQAFPMNGITEGPDSLYLFLFGRTRKGPSPVY